MRYASTFSGSTSSASRSSSRRSSRRASKSGPSGARRVPMRLLPPLLVLLNFVVPPLLIFARVGELDVHWLPVRLLGFVVSLYAAGMLLWAAATLGRFLVPQAVVLPDHDLVTSGPYRFVRHPAYSGDLALWLGAALGTANAILLLLWPVSVFGTYLQTRQEDALLASKFGAAYESYAKRTGRFLPLKGARNDWTRGPPDVPPWSDRPVPRVLARVGMTENSGDADDHFWRVAHSGLVAGGVWSIATGAAARHLSLDGRSISILAWSVVLANYGFLLNGVARAAAGRSGQGQPGVRSTGWCSARLHWRRWRLSWLPASPSSAHSSLSARTRCGMQRDPKGGRP